MTLMIQVLIGNPTVGDTTRFLTNYKAELHETGYSKYQSNTEKHRVYMAHSPC